MLDVMNCREQVNYLQRQWVFYAIGDFVVAQGDAGEEVVALRAADHSDGVDDVPQ